MGATCMAMVWGAQKLEAHVLANPAFHVPGQLVLVDAPAGLAERIMAVIGGDAELPWTTPDLCERIGRTLEESGWVESVRFVRRYADRRILISCRYRTAAALYQVGGDFYAVSPDGVRLPGRYGHDPAFVTVQGVQAFPPDEGHRWSGDDSRAALTLWRLLNDANLTDQVTGILVDNVNGRRSSREPHIVLATAPGGGRIIWGSAPGREIEEPSVEQKLAILAQNRRQFGRLDAGFTMIDISVFPDRFLTPERGDTGGHW